MIKLYEIDCGRGPMTWDVYKDDEFAASIVEDYLHYTLDFLDSMGVDYTLYTIDWYEQHIALEDA